MIKNKDQLRLNVLHQQILRLIQVLGDLHENLPEDTVISEISQNLVNCINWITKKQIDCIKEGLKVILDSSIEREQEEFDRYYSKIKKLYEFLIRKQKMPSRVDYNSLGIDSNEISLIQHLMIELMHDGEPQFELSELLAPEESDSLTLNEQSIIRGRDLPDIMEEIQKKYLQLSSGDLPVIFLSDLIIRGGFNFTEARQLGQFLEMHGVMVVREAEQIPDLESYFNAPNTNTINQESFMFLEWPNRFSPKSYGTFQFCTKCGLPVNPEINLPENSPIESCEFCNAK